MYDTFDNRIHPHEIDNLSNDDLYDKFLTFKKRISLKFRHDGVLFNGKYYNLYGECEQTSCDLEIARIIKYSKVIDGVETPGLKFHIVGDTDVHSMELNVHSLNKMIRRLAHDGYYVKSYNDGKRKFILR